MRIEAPSVVYFINEKYGVVLKANGETKEVSLWDPGRQGFTKRVDLLTASFLARTDQVEGRWCAAHPTYRLKTAIAAAGKLKPTGLPGKDGTALAREAKRAAALAELAARGAEAVIAEARRSWKEREARLAA